MLIIETSLQALKRSVTRKLAFAQARKGQCMQEDDTKLKTPPQTEYSILQQREIEAHILKNVFVIASQRWGEQAAKDLIAETCAQAAIEHGQHLAQENGKIPNLEDFMNILHRWTAGNALEIEVLESSATKLHFNVTRCRYAELYKDLGLQDLGPLLSCERDGRFCEGYNRDIVFQRTQTIMQGASHCDFKYDLPSTGNNEESQS